MKVMNRIISMRWCHHITFLFAGFLVASCATNPVTGKKEIMLMSESQEIALGKQSDPSIVAQFGAYDDPEIQSFIHSEGQKMAKISHRPHLSWEFKILDSPVVNAFAVPGGYVYFTRGIMAHFNNEAEFAGVLGHEIGHVTARHSAKQQSRAQLAQVAFIGGLIFSPAIRAMAQETQQALGLLFLKYGRDAESQSDQLGVEYSTTVGYDAHEMADFFQTLNRLQKQSGADQIPDFLSTHPNPEDRYFKVHEAAKIWQTKDPRTSYEVGRNEYLALIDGIVYGEDPRQGYTENNVFYHPELRFQFPVPRNYKLYNSPQQVQMVPEDQKNAIIFRLSQQKSNNLAANELQEQIKWQVVDRKNTTVNGNPAIAIIADIVPQQQQGQQQQPTTRVLTYLIEFGGLVYVFHGLSALADFDARFNAMRQPMIGFKKLTDPSRINVKPERIDIATVQSNTTISQALMQNGIPSSRISEFCILNGMERNDPVAIGTKIKVIEKGTLR